MNGKTSKIVAIVVSLILCAALIVADVMASVWKTAIDNTLTGYGTNADNETISLTGASGKELAQMISDEGYVLAQNTGSLLPLSKDIKKVNVFGYDSVDWIYSGSGSGTIRTVDDTVDFLGALQTAGIAYNTELADMYKSFWDARGSEVGGRGRGTLGYSAEQFCRIYEPSFSDKYYSDSLLANAKAYSDTAFVCIGRDVGESDDCPTVQYKINESGMTAPMVDSTRHYLELTSEEEALITWVGANFDKVIVLINSTNPMELGFMETIPGLDACLVVGGTGNYGAHSIVNIVWGDVNPSGKFVDTYAYEMESAASYANSGALGTIAYNNTTPEMYPRNVNNGNDNTGNYENVTFVDYLENIYVDYKWYETAFAEGVKIGSWDYSTEDGYSKVVQYPFGYGLSYTTFDKEIIAVHPAPGSAINSDTEIKVTVRVSNSGSAAGKEALQLYYTAPYTVGGIEKAAVNLVAFDKTIELAPNDYQDIELSFKAYEMASYDCYDRNQNGFAGYELEAGTYQVKLMDNAHKLSDVIVAGGTSAHDSAIIEYKVENALKIERDPVSGNIVSNKFTGTDAMDFGIALDGSTVGVDLAKYLTRANFAGTFPKTSSPRAMTDDVIALNLFDDAEIQAWENAHKTDETVNFGVSHGVSLYDYDKGEYTSLALQLGNPDNWNSDIWNDVLEQATREDIIAACGRAGYAISEMDSISLPGQSSMDGPNQFGSFPGFFMETPGTGWSMAPTLAQTFNVRLARAMGLQVATEAANAGMDIWYGPGVNIHRSPFGGRNYEYFGADGFLSGTIAGNVIDACHDGGLYTYLKHFVLYDQDTFRDGVYNWCTEQALREIYLKPFQVAISKYGCTGVMTAYNRIGATWSGGSEALNTGIMRDEWGFKGTILTDFCDNEVYNNLYQVIASGSELWMKFRGQTTEIPGDTNTNAMDVRLRDAAKHIIYTIANAAYLNSVYNSSDDAVQIVRGAKTHLFSWWIIPLVILNVVVVALCAFWIYKVFKKKKKAA